MPGASCSFLLVFTSQEINTKRSPNAEKLFVDFFWSRRHLLDQRSTRGVLYGVDVPKCALPLLLGYMSGIDHIHYFNLGRELFLAPLFSMRGSSSSSLRGLLPVSSVVSLPTYLITQQLRLVWLVGLSEVPCI